ncbi:hypothetical protein GCM10011591_33450 [Nocardia camponoti]|uniref:Uncharacterized protein n=1 Tax=Nocardia camponoti TaxID=1616106 RepID=A0A917VBC0_9NOCA|nr:hypothetical protein GCM10011591_33450 [Nocardia camponoti]
MHHTKRDTGRLRDIARGHTRDTLFFGKANRGLDQMGSPIFDAQSGGHLSELIAHNAKGQFACPAITSATELKTDLRAFIAPSRRTSLQREDANAERTDKQPHQTDRSGISPCGHEPNSGNRDRPKDEPN